MNLMREQHFRRNCAQHTISVASALFGECRTEGKPELAELCDRIVSTPEWSVARWDTVTAFLHNRRLQLQRIAVAANPAEGWCHEDILGTGCRPDIPPYVGRTLLHRRSLRPAPKRPEILLWASRIAIDYADLGGIRVRCIKAGVGPNLVLLHTLRTQLDMFEKIIPELEKHFTVHAFDYPGHGWSEFPKAAYAPEDF